MPRIDIRPARELPADRPCQRCGATIQEFVVDVLTLLTKYLQRPSLVADHMYWILKASRASECSSKRPREVHHPARDSRFLRPQATNSGLFSGAASLSNAAAQQSESRRRRHRRPEQGERAILDDRLAGTRGAQGRGRRWRNCSGTAPRSRCNRRRPIRCAGSLRCATHRPHAHRHVDHSRARRHGLSVASQPLMN